MFQHDKTAWTDLLGHFIKITPVFRGKVRVIHYWMNHRDKNSRRIRLLPGGGAVVCDLAVPYEAMVWLEQEEQKDLENLRYLLRPGHTFVDCGANIGIWTIVAASTVKETGKVYAFEPNPSTFEKLSKNLSLGRLLDKNIQLFCSAVGGQNTELKLACNQSHNISQIIDPETAESASNLIAVPVVKLDSVLTDVRVNGIKIDVEGYELEVLKGAETILKRERPWLCVEFNTLLAKVNRLGDWDVHRYLSNLGYVSRHFQEAFDGSEKIILTDDWQTTGYCNLYYSTK